MASALNVHDAKQDFLFCSSDRGDSSWVSNLPGIQSKETSALHREPCPHTQQVLIFRDHDCRGVLLLKNKSKSRRQYYVAQ
ncbi:hypothetical protein NQZ68_024478 [Dissostichus eleginoides]|nr:hypothetical protein NQZ68_024478 [Dissostichus eleginoides]